MIIAYRRYGVSKSAIWLKHIAQYGTPHIGQYGGGHIGQYAHSELGDSLLLYRRYGFSISPIWWQHIEDLAITYLYFECCQSLFLRVFFKGIGLNESSGQ